MARRIRLLLTISDLVGRGAEREFVNLVGRLDRDRFEPMLCFWRRVFDYPCPADMPLEIVDKTRPWHLLRTVTRVTELIDRWQPDLVFSQLPYVGLVAGMAIARSRQRPAWVARLVNDPRRDFPFPLSLWGRQVFRRADRVIACSRGVGQALESHLHLRPDQVVTLDNVVELDSIDRLAAEPPPIERENEPFLVAHMGRFVRQKDQRTLIDAFGRICGRPARLWMLGVGRERPRLERMLHRRGVAHYANWLGFRENPYPLLRQADCFVLTSRHEGLPNALIEAQALGLPVVSTRCPFGPDELIDDSRTGMLVPVGDREALARALTRLAGDPALRRAMGEQAREAVRRRFDPTAVVRQYEAVFADAVDRHRRG